MSRISKISPVGLEYPFGTQPHLQMDHIDGPLLRLRDGRLHWLTLLERVLLAIGYHDAYSIERKHWDATPASTTEPKA